MILVANKTKDEAYLFISRIRERRMRDTVLKIKERMDHGMPADANASGQKRLG